MMHELIWQEVGDWWRLLDFYTRECVDKKIAMQTRVIQEESEFVFATLPDPMFVARENTTVNRLGVNGFPPFLYGFPPNRPHVRLFSHIQSLVRDLSLVFFVPDLRRNTSQGEISRVFFLGKGKKSIDLESVVILSHF